MDTTKGHSQSASVSEGDHATSRVWGVWWIHPVPTGRFDPLHGPRTRFGRDAQCDHGLDGAEVSRQHAEILQEEGCHSLRDLGSKNGVFLNGRPCRDQPVHDGDVIRVGEWVGLFGLSGSRGQPVSTLWEGQQEAGGLLAGPRLQAVLAPLRAIAITDLAIAISGETGTGKEVVARRIHAVSGRKGAFLGVNCAAFPESLAEAELFGHSRGAFTGAERARPGHFREVDGGTLLLDEIGDLSLAVQAKLLRVLEERAVCPLGESRALPVDVRIIVASQRPLAEAVAEGKFRRDLFARLSGFTLQLPSLHERAVEVAFLFRRLFARERPRAPEPELTALAVERLCLHPWPFNVRELVQVVRRMLALHPHLTRINHEMAAEALQVAGASSNPGDQRTALLAAWRACDKNLTKAAAQLGISRGRAYRLLGEDKLDELRNDS